MELRPFQVQDVASLRAEYQAGRTSVLYVLSTGGGKTVVFSHIVKGAVSKGNTVCILVHRQELLLQASEKLTDLGVNHGLIAPGHTPTRDPVQIASVQTLVGRMGRGEVGGFALLVIDEAHHSTAGSWSKILAMNAAKYPGARVLGVTATPIRLDGKGLGAIFQSMVEGPPIAELIRLGYLAPPKVFAPPMKADLSGLRVIAGEFAKNQMAERMDKPTITGDAVDHYRRILQGAPSIVFCASVAHAAHVAAEFRGAGYKAATVDGGMEDRERKRIIGALGAGQLNILTSCEIVSEGTDLPVVAGAILLRPTASLGLYLQQVGRALRPSPDKTYAIILDHVGNCVRHGLPDDVREWDLAGVKSRGKGATDTGPGIAVKQCPKCFACHRPAPFCPHCGHKYQIELLAPDKVAGELEEITPERAEAMRLAKRMEIGRAKSLEDLETIAAARGYQKGWAKIIWEAREKSRQKRIEAQASRYYRKEIR